jgi:hypothetical protein
VSAYQRSDVEQRVQPVEHPRIRLRFDERTLPWLLAALFQRAEIGYTEEAVAWG